MFLSLFLFLFLFTKEGFSVPKVDKEVWLSGAAYCDHYDTMHLGGPVTDFIYKATLYDKTSDLKGYVGVLPSSETIYVVLRGSSSVKNWLEDFEARLVSYDSYPSCKCKVHNGFYHSSLNIANQTIAEVNKLKYVYPSYHVIITGHSYGASCGLLLALELNKNGIISPKVYNFGQPRVGDANFSKLVIETLPEYYRFVHDRDMVPHVPPTQIGYIHSCIEIFEEKSGKLRTCSATNCEDTNCSAQYKITQTNTGDHSYYLGHYLSCEDSTI